MSLAVIVYYSVLFLILISPTTVTFYKEPNILSKILILTYVHFYLAKSISASTVNTAFLILAFEASLYKPVKLQI